MLPVDQLLAMDRRGHRGSSQTARGSGGVRESRNCNGLANGLGQNPEQVSDI